MDALNRRFLALPLGKHVPVPRGRTRALNNADEERSRMVYLVLLAPVAGLVLLMSMAAVESWHQKGPAKRHSQGVS